MERPPKIFNSFPVATRGRARLDARAREVIPETFQFFPSCYREGGGDPLLDVQAFNSFPVATIEQRARVLFSAPTLSILSQLLRGMGARTTFLRHLSFNSFPVATEALAAWLLINLSSANFEVPENLPALPSYTCSGSRKPFPDSRRKEGR